MAAGAARKTVFYSTAYWSPSGWFATIHGMWRCHQCKTTWESDRRAPGAKEICPTCSAYLHCCLNCKHHDRHAHNQCRIPNTDWVADRKGPNFCDEFEFAGAPGAVDTGTGRQAKDAFSQLFGEGGNEDATPGFDDLFKKD